MVNYCKACGCSEEQCDAYGLRSKCCSACSHPEKVEKVTTALRIDLLERLRVLQQERDSIQKDSQGVLRSVARDELRKRLKEVDAEILQVTQVLQQCRVADALEALVEVLHKRGRGVAPEQQEIE
jgi:hypothetical protein